MTIAFKSRVNFGLPLFGGVQTAVVIFIGRWFKKFNAGNHLFFVSPESHSIISTSSSTIFRKTLGHRSAFFAFLPMLDNAM